MKTVPPIVHRFARLFLAVGFCAATDFPTDLAAAGQPEELMLVGRLATVEPSGRRITLIPEGEEDLAELIVSEDVELRQGERELTLEELVIQVGRRVTAHYREVEGRRLLLRLIVEE